MTAERALIIVNPISGGADKSGLCEEISKTLTDKKIDARWFETNGEKDLERLQKEISQFNPDLLVAVGGDGTVHLAAQALEQHNNIPIAIIPSGSGNGLSKDLGIPQNNSDALALLSDNRLKAVDTLRINGKLCVHIADLGFNALVVKRFDEAPTRGPGTYAKVAMQEYINYEPGYYKIETDAGNFEGEAFMITITNGRNFGSSATVNPKAIMDDGKFEVCILAPFPKATAPVLLFRMYNQTIDESVYSKIISCRKAVISSPETELLQIDGEIMPPVNKIEVQIKEKGLTVLLPPAIEGNQ
ncbi:MAG: diacylglycerol kinase family lipid kinase, partial [Chitinophagaceae bacterium]